MVQSRIPKFSLGKPFFGLPRNLGIALHYVPDSYAGQAYHRVEKSDQSAHHDDEVLEMLVVVLEN
jgi:hypothetical protein